MRSFLTGPLVRLFPVGLCVLAIQRTVLSELLVHQVVLQIVLALAAAAGAGAGPERGAIAGFTFGLMYDLATGSPLGLTALVYSLAGFVAGYVVTITPTPQWWLASIFATIGAAVEKQRCQWGTPSSARTGCSTNGCSPSCPSCRHSPWS